ncbi:MAG: type II toxin-antitoxin system VapC family toxin [Promethearchaeota archaeon]
MAIFIDTGFFLGLVDPTDSYYNRSEELLKILQTGKYGQIFTSTYIIAETMTLVAVRTKKNGDVMHEISEFFTGNKQIARILRPDDQIENDTVALFLKTNQDPQAKLVSFVDCSNVIFCRKRSIEHILAYDRHFDAWLSRIH